MTASLRIAFALAVAAACGGLAVDPVRAADFKGQTVNLAIASGTGGGYDAYGRLAARHLGRHLPGAPAVVPRNMPGAGGVVAANFVFNVAPKDGTAIGIFQAGTPYEPLFGNAQAKFDSMAFNWLISLNRIHNIGIFWHDSPIRTVDDLFKGEVLVGSSGGGNASTQVFPNLLNNIINTRFKVIAGYKGTGETNLAMERGEVHGIVGTEWASLKANRPDWIRDNKVRVVLQIALTTHPELPGVPLINDHVKSADDRAVLELLLARQQYGRPFAAPPGVPAATVAVLRQGFAAMAKDADFLADAEKLRADIEIGTPDDIIGLLRRTYGAPRPLVERAIAEFKSAGGGD